MPGHVCTLRPVDFDLIVIGAGAAGMMCAAQAGARGRRVLLIEHAEKIGERIRISGGGRCNFTNRTVGAAHFLSQNPHFARSALARYTPNHFIALLESRGIAWEEREHGQLFCRDSAQQVIDLLLAACEDAGVQWAHPCSVQEVERLGQEHDAPGAGADAARFRVHSSHGSLECASLVVATGGLAVPKIGATPFGYRLAEQFGLKVVPPRPALVPLALDPETLAVMKPLSGLSLRVATEGGLPGAPRFTEDMLVTHRGLSGPAILQASSYWQMQAYAGGNLQPLHIDLMPGENAAQWLEEQRHSGALLATLLSERMPRRFAQEWCALHGFAKPLAEYSNREIAAAAAALGDWTLMPSGTLGYAKAEVTLGGVDTDALSSKTMEARAVPGLYFIGEVVDVTGWLGGYNFQWAWSSGWVAGQFA